MHRLNWLALLAALLIIACKQAPQPEVVENSFDNLSETGIPTPDWINSANLYELNTRQFSKEGNFAGVSEQIPRLKEMGVDIIWFMPIHPVSEKKRKAKDDLEWEDIEDPEERKLYLGSPYSVGDYKGVNPDYGTPEEFKNMVTKIHDNDMKIIIDFVPNHTGWDNPWITSNPEWYTQDSLGNIIDPIDYNTGEPWGWTDVADLNFDNQDMRLAMIDAMQFWLSEYDIDGFRVDAAHGIPQDFWDQLTPELLKTKEDIFMLAESEVPSHRNQGTYHSTYGWSFHHLMNEIARGEKPDNEILHWFEEDRKKYSKGFNLQFTSNHDENTWAGTVFDRMGEGHKALAVLAGTLDGMFLLYNGQEEPLRKRLEFFVSDPIDWKDYAYTDFYKALLNLKHENQAIWNGDAGGEANFIHDDDKSIAYSRTQGDNEVVVILNLSDASHSIALDFNPEGYTELYGESISRDAEGNIELEPWAYYIFSK